MKAEGRKGVTNIFFAQKENIPTQKNKWVSKFAGTDKVGSSSKKIQFFFFFLFSGSNPIFLFSESRSEIEKVYKTNLSVLHTLFSCRISEYSQVVFRLDQAPVAVPRLTQMQRLVYWALPGAFAEMQVNSGNVNARSRLKAGYSLYRCSGSLFTFPASTGLNRGEREIGRAHV